MHRCGQKGRRWTGGPSLPPCGQLTRCFSAVAELLVVQSHKSRARDLDLEHILDACSPGDHRAQVLSQSSRLCRSRSDLRKVYRRTNGRTDRRRTPRDCISSQEPYSKIIRPPKKSVTGKSEPEFYVKQLFRIIQGHSFGDHQKAVER